MSLLMPEIAEQPGLLVEDRLHLLRREPEGLEQVEDHAGIERAGPRAHAQPVERGEAERAVDALAVLQRAQAGAAAEVGDDHAPVGDLRRHLRQDRGDVLVREAVEAVALDAASRSSAGSGTSSATPDCAAMEAGVEAGDLRHAGQALGHRLDRGEVVRLMQRRERNQGAQIVEHFRRDDDRAARSRAAVHDPMADAEHARAAVPAAQPVGQRVERGRGRRRRCLSSVSLGDDGAAAILGGEAGRRPDAFDLAARLERHSWPRRAAGRRRTSGSRSRH